MIVDKERYNGAKGFTIRKVYKQYILLGCVLNIYDIYHYPLYMCIFYSQVVFFSCRIGYRPEMIL